MRPAWPAVFALFALQCGSSASSPTPAGPTAAIPATSVPTPAPSPSSSPSASPGPVGTFRVEPPAAPGHVISISRGATVHLHGSGSDAPNDQPLTLFADWGDGKRSRDYCGPCRVEHSYAATGQFTLTGTLVSPIGGARRTWTVAVH